MECQGYRLIEVSGAYAAVLFQILKENGISRLGLEGDHQTCNQYFNLCKVCEGVEIKPLSDQVEQLRILKDGSEIELIEQAVSIADQAFAQILPVINPGVAEQEIALQLEYAMRRMAPAGVQNYCYRRPFPPAAWGRLRQNNRGGGSGHAAVYHGYHSDITGQQVNSLNMRRKILNCPGSADECRSNC